ncbi:hypothetical protein GCM10022630_36010 [Thermobifida alba]
MTASNRRDSSMSLPSGTPAIPTASGAGAGTTRSSDRIEPACLPSGRVSTTSGERESRRDRVIALSVETDPTPGGNGD